MTETNETPLCSICCENILPIEKIHMPCESIIHIFHRKCFNLYRKSPNYKDNKNCPMCRSNVTLPAMKPKGTIVRRIIFNHTQRISLDTLEKEKKNLKLLCDKNSLIEKYIEINLNSLNINIKNIKKEKLIVDKKHISKQTNQTDWLIELYIKKQLLEKEYHAQYIQELYQAFIE